MVLLEKIDKLLLITIEGKFEPHELEDIKQKLSDISKDKHEVVVSLDLSYMEKRTTSFTSEQSLNELLKFCHVKGIRVHFYRFA